MYPEMMETDVEGSVPITNEEYLVLRAKNALLYDPYEAKSWMLTAQTLFPNDFGVQFEAYHIEKSAGNVKEAAKCFSALMPSSTVHHPLKMPEAYRLGKHLEKFMWCIPKTKDNHEYYSVIDGAFDMDSPDTFPDEVELWAEIKAVTTALRLFEENNAQGEERENMEMSESKFLIQLFYQVPTTVQHALLLTCAEKTPDNMEHCKLMLLLFNKFPLTVINYGTRLMENLITAEKHSLMQHNPVNSYRKLLVCDLLPLLGTSQLDLQPKNLYRLLHKAIEFYLSYVFDHSNKEESKHIKIEEPWVKLWEIMFNIGSKLAWDLSITFAGYWNKDNYWTALYNCYQAHPMTMDDSYLKQIVYCATLILLRCLHEYLSFIEPDSVKSYALLEGFSFPPGPNEPLPKRNRVEDDINLPILTCGANLSTNVIHSFVVAVRCWDLLHINENIERDFTKLMTHLKLENWLKTFSLDVTLYKGHYEQLMTLLLKYNEIEGQGGSLSSDLLLLSCYYCMQNFTPIVDIVVKIASSLPNATGSTEILGNPLAVTTRHARHLHYLPLTRINILQYCVKILLAALKLRKTELTMGHVLVLIQLDFPVEEELLNEVTTMIQHRGSFSYPIFTYYIINVDILEQFAYLSNDQGPKISLDILPPNQQLHNQRRMSTRGVDKGVKEDLRMAIRRQVSRSNEPIDALIIKFLTRERELIHHSLLDS